MPEQPPRRASGKAVPARPHTKPQASGGSGGSPRRASGKTGPARQRAGQADGKAREAEASAATTDGAAAGGRVRPRASQPAKLAGASAVPAGGTGGRETRLDVRKTYKLFIGGAFPRSESGRSYPVAGPDGTLLAHAARASRKDARDAVVAARKAGPGWAGATAYNRGQVL